MRHHPQLHKMIMDAEIVRKEIRSASWFLAFMAAIFSAFIGWQGNYLTSKQWVYLMGVPGGKWTWAFTFGVCSLAALWGLLARRRHLWAGFGLFGVGFFCGFVASCYVLAPLQDSTLRTGGWWPWIIAAAVYLYAGAKNAGQRE